MSVNTNVIVSLRVSPTKRKYENKWLRVSLGIAVIFSDVSERNHDYSDTLDFRRGEWGGGGGDVFRFEGP